MWLWTTVCCIVADDTKWRRSCDRIWQGRSTTKNHIYWAHGCQDEPTYTAATSAACQRDPSAAVWDMRLRPKECASANSRNSISQHCLTAGQASWRMGTSPRTKTLLLAGPTLRRGWSGWHNRGSGNKYGSSRWQLTREGDGCAGVAGLNHTFGETIFPWRDKLSKQGLAFKPLPSTFIWWLLWMIQGPIPKAIRRKLKLRWSFLSFVISFGIYVLVAWPTEGSVTVKQPPAPAISLPPPAPPPAVEATSHTFNRFFPCSCGFHLAS